MWWLAIRSLIVSSRPVSNFRHAHAHLGKGMAKAWASFRVWGTVAAILLLAAGAAVLVWADVRQFRQENRSTKNQAIVRDVAIQIEHDLIERNDRAAADLAGCDIVRQVLSGRAAADGPALRSALATARRLTGSTCIWFIDSKGIVRAFDHVDPSQSFAGSNLSSYPYIQACLAGRPTLHVGIGDSSQEAGIFHAVAARALPDAAPGGAIILKLEAPQVAQAMLDLPIPVVLQAADGTLLGCNRSEWWTLPPSLPASGALASADGAAHQVASGRDRPIISLPFDPRGESAMLDGSPHLIARHPIGDGGWTLIALLDVSTPPALTAAQQRHVVTRAVVLVLAGLMIIMLTVLVLKGSQLEASLRQSHARIEAANRAKDGFLALLSHELRTPLTPVLARVSLLEREDGLTPSMREAVTMIRRNVETEARLIDDLLDLTRADSGKLTLDQEVVDIHALAAQVAAMFEDEAREKQIVLTTELRAPRRHIKGDSHRLQQVLWNLVSNAIKFTPAGGQVRIIVGNEGASGDTLRIDVSDTGKGIDPSMCARLFAPFEQGGGEVTREFGGLGLGLAICKTLVHAHHGTLTATSDGLGQGATFSIRLAALDPAAIPTAQPHRSPEAPLASAPSVPMRILLVEDHVDTRRVLERLLQDMGHTVTAAACVLDALQAARTREFDLVLSDLGLPDGSGTDLLQQLRQNGNANLRAVSISGYGSESDIASSRAAGFTAHLTKPVRVEQIEQVLAVPDPNR